jgi:hypothetical protein
MTQAQLLRRVRRAHWRGLRDVVRRAYHEGFEAGLARAHGTGRRGRTIRGDATVAGLIRIIERHFSLKRYGFEVRIVHSRSGRKVPTSDQIRKYRVAEPS